MSTITICGSGFGLMKRLRITTSYARSRMSTTFSNTNASSTAKTEISSASSR